MNCDEIHIRIQDYLEGELESSQQSSLEEHIDNCEACSREFNLYREMFSLLGDLGWEEVPEGFRAGVMEAVRRRLGREEKSLLARMIKVNIPVPRKLRPVAAGILALLALLFPALTISAVGKRTVGGTVVWLSDLLVSVKEFLQGFDFFYRLFGVLKRDLGAMRSIIDTVTSLLWSSGESYILAGLALAIMILFLVAFLYKSFSKRRPHNASFCI